jgi:uncharacterized protein YxeA
MKKILLIILAFLLIVSCAKEFEYKTVFKGITDSNSIFINGRGTISEQELNELSKDKWELVSITKATGPDPEKLFSTTKVDGNEYIFKRIKK